MGGGAARRRRRRRRRALRADDAQPSHVLQDAGAAGAVLWIRDRRHPLRPAGGRRGRAVRRRRPDGVAGRGRRPHGGVLRAVGRAVAAVARAGRAAGAVQDDRAAVPAVGDRGRARIPVNRQLPVRHGRKSGEVPRRRLLLRVPRIPRPRQPLARQTRGPPFVVAAAAAPLRRRAVVTPRRPRLCRAPLGAPRPCGGVWRPRALLRRFAAAPPRTPCA
ncbi:MAG: hypothetical protein J3K34DRAFT_407726 [Monoraphidium minutum]|nr:MAG: hypothetical protein J3K34DRAFT_407726 [Monoraphidium minutum]